MNSAVLSALLCVTSAFAAEVDVVTFIDQAPTPFNIPTLYSDTELQKAVREFADLPRPWTVPKLIELFARECSAFEMIQKEPKWWIGPRLEDYFRLERRIGYAARLLGASRDPRAGVVLGKALEGKNHSAAIGAVWAICHFFCLDPRYKQLPVDTTPRAVRFWDDDKQARDWWNLNKTHLEAGIEKAEK